MGFHRLTATDLIGYKGNRTPKEAAAIAVCLATLDSFGPTGGFFFKEDADTRPPRCLTAAHQRC